MKGLLGALVGAVLAAPYVSGLSKITRNGKYLYDSSGTRFFIKVSLIVSYIPLYTVDRSPLDGGPVFRLTDLTERQGIAYQQAGQLPSQTVAGEFPEPTTFVDP